MLVTLAPVPTTVATGGAPFEVGIHGTMGCMTFVGVAYPMTRGPDGWVAGEVLGALVALFLASERDEDHRSLRPRAGSERAGDLDEAGDAGRVVVGAVVDRVAAAGRWMVAEVMLGWSPIAEWPLMEGPLVMAPLEGPPAGSLSMVVRWSSVRSWSRSLVKPLPGWKN